jgi:flagellar assembly factor FliW
MFVGIKGLVFYKNLNKGGDGVSRAIVGLPGLQATMTKIAVKKKIRFTTTRFGLVEVNEDNLITFAEGIPGFPQAKKFVLIPHAEDSPFTWLQSADIPDLAFVVTDPWLFFEDYKPVVSEVDLESLNIKDSPQDSLVVFSILTLPGDPHKMTANLQAPIIINSSNNMAKQVILVSENYTTKHLLLAS